jgi:hypothetical protein
MLSIKPDVRFVAQRESHAPVRAVDSKKRAGVKILGNKTN